MGGEGGGIVEGEGEEEEERPWEQGVAAVFALGLGTLFNCCLFSKGIKPFMWDLARVVA